MGVNIILRESEARGLAEIDRILNVAATRLPGFTSFLGVLNGGVRMELSNISEPPMLKWVKMKGLAISGITSPDWTAMPAILNWIKGVHILSMPFVEVGFTLEIKHNHFSCEENCKSTFSFHTNEASNESGISLELWEIAPKRVSLLAMESFFRCCQPLVRTPIRIVNQNGYLRLSSVASELEVMSSPTGDNRIHLRGPVEWDSIAETLKEIVITELKADAIELRWFSLVDRKAMPEENFTLWKQLAAVNLPAANISVNFSARFEKLESLEYISKFPARTLAFEAEVGNFEIGEREAAGLLVTSVKENHYHLEIHTSWYEDDGIAQINQALGTNFIRSRIV